MTDTTLSASVGNAATDVLLHGVVGIFETAFAGRIRSWYLEGSYADGSALATSDIDLTIVFKDRFASDAEREAATRLAASCAMVSGVELDIALADDAGLAAGVSPMLKEGSLCLYGEDRRAASRLLPLEEWACQRMHAAYWLLVTVFDRPRVVVPPLRYPDPADAFFGYARRTVRVPTGAEAPSTRDLMRVTGWIATALLAQRAGVYVARKSDCARAYRQSIGDEWAVLLDDIYRRCRVEWGYLVPTAEADRRELRALCARALHFENYFLAIYKDYLLAQLRSADDSALHRALWVLEHVTYDDERVRLAVRTLGDHDDQEIRQAAARVQAIFDRW